MENRYRKPNPLVESLLLELPLVCVAIVLALYSLKGLAWLCLWRCS